MYQGMFMVLKLDIDDTGWKLFSDYDPELINKIKTLLNKNSRSLSPHEKCWRISKNYSHKELEQLLGKNIDLTPNALNYTNKDIQDLEFIQDFKHDKLFDFQIEGVKKLLQKRRYILADEMGLGKSAMSVTGASYLLNTGKVKCIMIICPKSLKQQWKNEIQKWTDATDEDIDIIEGSKKTREGMYFNLSKWKILNYEQLRNDIPRIHKNCVIIFDEASKLKNNNTKIYETVYGSYNDVDYAWLLTGTPIENGLDNFFNLINLLDHNFMSRREFNNEHVIFDQIDIGDREINVVAGYTNIDKFKQLALPYYIRREKKDVATHLLPKNVEIRYIDMTTEQQKMASNIYDLLEELQGDEETKGKFQLAALSILRSIASHPQALLESDSDLAKQCYDSEASTKKIEEVRDIIEDNTGKIIIFTEFSRSARILAEELKEFNPVIITGGMDAPTEVEKFKKEEKHRLLIMTNVGAYGLSIDEADTAIIYDLPYNPAILKQKEDRIYRINSTRQKNIIYLISGVEHKVYDIIIKKQELFDSAIVPTKIMRQLVERVK